MVDYEPQPVLLPLGSWMDAPQTHVARDQHPLQASQSLQKPAGTNVINLMQHILLFCLTDRTMKCRAVANLAQQDGPKSQVSIPASYKQRSTSLSNERKTNHFIN